MNTPFRARAKSSHVAQNEYELEFREGDIITILEVSGDAATGELRGSTGVLNLNLVDILHEASGGSKPIPLSSSDEVRPAARGSSVSKSDWRSAGAQPAADLTDNWDDEDAAAADSVAVSVGPGLSAAPAAPSAFTAPPPPALGPASAGVGASAVQSGFAETELQASEALLMSSFAYINQILKGEELLISARRHIWWVAFTESFLMFFFLIFYFAYTFIPTTHLIWLHIVHILRLPIVWYLAVKLRQVMTMDQLKLVLDPKTNEHIEFFNNGGLVVKAAIAFAVATGLAAILDFVAIWVRLSYINLCFSGALSQPCTMASVFMVFSVVLFALSVISVLFVPTLKWGVPAELLERLIAHMKEYAPIKTASQPVGPPAVQAQPQPVAPAMQVPAPTAAAGRTQF